MTIVRAKRPRPRAKPAVPRPPRAPPQPDPAEEARAQAFLERMLSDGRAAYRWARERGRT